MSVPSYLQRVLLANLLTIYYNMLMLLMFAVTYLKNPFSNPWAQKLKLEPPSRLTDPKYGVHKSLKVNNTVLHYVESGSQSKPLMLFLHGFPEFWYSWRHQIVDFQKDYWCIAVDMRGYGDSERPEGVSSYRIEILIEDVRDLIRQLEAITKPEMALGRPRLQGLSYPDIPSDTTYPGYVVSEGISAKKVGRDKCILISHDWGGLIACRFRDQYPEVLSALVMLASISSNAWYREVWNNPIQRRKSWYVFLYRAPIIPELTVSINDLAIYETLMLGHGKSTTDKEDIECYKYWFRKPYALTPPINYYRANFSFDNSEAAEHKENVPMLVAHAANDHYLSHSMLDTMKKEYSCIETTIVEGTGHFLQQEDPEKVNKLIRDFLLKHNL